MGLTLPNLSEGYFDCRADAIFYLEYPFSTEPNLGARVFRVMNHTHACVCIK